MMHGDGHEAPSVATMDSDRPQAAPQLVVDLGELRAMRTEIVAVKASVDHLLQVLTLLITTAETPAG